MFVEFWGVGETAVSALPMTRAHICSHLLADWVPSFPASVSSSFVGWPQFLIEDVSSNGQDFLALRSEAGRSERQWKGVLSWMIGVAGTRHVLLRREGYRWIAPLSAFYPEVAQAVDISTWHPSFPPSVLVATRPSGSRSRLRPDYVALRPLSRGQPMWAIAESKGTHRSLSMLNDCPDAWSKQARNAQLRVNDSPVFVPRHLVVATRVNPNAKRKNTRCIQVRAWNSTERTAQSILPSEFATEIACAHLFGLFRNLRLVDNARALASSVRTRRAQRLQQPELFHRPLERFLELADAELARHRGGAQAQDKVPMYVSIGTDFGPIKVEIAWATISLVQRLQRAPGVEAAAEALEEADRELDTWESRSRAYEVDDPHGRQRAALPFGINVDLPTEGDPR